MWHNSTPLEQPYYSWMNTGMPAAGNLEFIFPEIDTWVMTENMQTGLSIKPITKHLLL
ncbi:MAG: DUF5107 domain-containing protein [Saprospiraceae bacterium]|nr:DUF5107 domain-containing protein [Saprospiraceae bacterium]